MADDLAQSPRGAVTLRGRRTRLWTLLASVPLLLLAIGALIGRIVAEFRAGETTSAMILIGSGVAVGLLVVATFVGIAIYLRKRLQRRRQRFVLLEQTFAGGVAFLVEYPTLALSDDSPSDWKVLKPSSINAVAVEAGILSLLRIRDGIEVVGRVEHAVTEVNLTTRSFHNTEVSQISMSLRARSFSVSLGVLPTDTRLFSVPPLPNLGALVTELRAAFGANQAPGVDMA